MTRKKDDKKKKEKKDDKQPKERKPIVFDPSDGVTWHDFLGLFVILLKIIWRIVKIVLSPIFWVYGELVRMWRFIRATSSEEPMDRYQKDFFETVPVIFTLTGLVGGAVIGLLAIISIDSLIDNFLAAIRLDFLGAIGDAIITVLEWIWIAIKAIAVAIWAVITWVAGLVSSAFAKDPFLAFIVLAGIGMVVVILWLILSEKGVFTKIKNIFLKIIGVIIDYPEDLGLKLSNIYRGFNHKVASLIVGEERIETRTQVYFKKVVMYTMLTSAWSFLSGLYVSLDRIKSGTYVEQWQMITFTAFVLLVAGIISGYLFLAIIANFLDFYNRGKYIAKEFKLDDGSKDKDKIKERIREVAEQKPWLKKKVVKKEESKEENKE